jgi:hypothetical protein
VFSSWGFFSCFQFEDFPLRVNIFHLEYSPVLTMRMWSHYINSISPIIQKLNNEQEQEEDNKEHTLPNGGRSTKTSAVQNTQHWNKCTNVMWRSGCRWTCEFLLILGIVHYHSWYYPFTKSIWHRRLQTKQMDNSLYTLYCCWSDSHDIVCVNTVTAWYVSLQSRHSLCHYSHGMVCVITVTT